MAQRDHPVPWPIPPASSPTATAPHRGHSHSTNSSTGPPTRRHRCGTVTNPGELPGDTAHRGKVSHPHDANPGRVHIIHHHFTRNNTAHTALTTSLADILPLQGNVNMRTVSLDTAADAVAATGVAATGAVILTTDGLYHRCRRLPCPAPAA